MKRLNRFVAGLGLAAVLVAGSSNVFAKSDGNSGARLRIISGQILSIDRNARTMIVRDASTNQTYSVQVPEGAFIRTVTLSGAPLTFEQLIAGMTVRDLAVR